MTPEEKEKIEEELRQLLAKDTTNYAAFRVDFEGEVYLYPTGGRRGPVITGYRPEHRVMPDYLTCGVHQYLDKDIVWPGESAFAVVSLIAPEYYPHTLNPGMDLEFYEGPKAVGKIRIGRIFNPLLDKGERF